MQARHNALQIEDKDFIVYKPCCVVTYRTVLEDLSRCDDGVPLSTSLAHVGICLPYPLRSKLQIN